MNSSKKKQQTSDNQCTCKTDEVDVGIGIADEDDAASDLAFGGYPSGVAGLDSPLAASSALCAPSVFPIVL